ncbi:MAG: hypothetical protein HQ574_05330, partial [Chloroflexi bacterium]|nr:hypothetical protein [Chloroflexota bacterium]
MIKKILIWTVYAVIVGVLIFGAANRTAAKTDLGVLFGKSDTFVEEVQRQGGSGNFGRSSESGEPDHDEITEEHDWVSFSGQVTIVDYSALEVQTENEGILEISGRSWSFAQELGYFPEVGNEIILNGFFENGEFEV